MSSIKKMSIQGIRSFGPEDKDKQIIQFYSPLTLILGANGTGKTTLIECLKYITTGDLPPGAKIGGAFIHDPKIAHEKEVKAQIKLSFLDIAGKEVIAVRSMTGTQKAKKVELKTLDGVITRHGPDGEKKSITQKCADLDREMVASLGVSKAVLENVIFCHQEEANWPLGEGKALKEKFDAIFASTRYVKALEAIRSFNKEQDQSVKNLKVSMKYLKENKDAVTKLENEKSDLEAQYASSEESVKKTLELLKPIEEKLYDIRNRSEEIHKLKTDVEVLMSEKRQIESQIEELENSIENKFQGSTIELQRKHRDFQEKLQEREELLTQSERELVKLNKESISLESKRNQLLIELGKLQQEADANEENQKNCSKLMKKLAEKYDIGGFQIEESLDVQYCSRFVKKLKEKYDQLMKEAKEKKAAFEEKEVDLQRQIDEVRENKTKLGQSIKMKQDIMDKNNSEIKRINCKLSETNASAGTLDQLTRELKTAEHELKSAESTVNPEELKKEIQNMNQEKKTLEEKFNKLDSILSVLHKQSTVKTQVDMLNKEKTAKEDQIRKSKARHEDSIVHLLGEMPNLNLRGALDEYISKQSCLVQKTNIELDKCRQEMSSKETQKKMLMENLRRDENELKNLEEKLQNVCGTDDFDDSLITIQSKLNQTQEQRGSLMGAEHFYKKYVEDMKKDNPCCPLCHREFEQEQEVRELILELQSKLRMVPSKLQKAEKDLNEYQNKYDSIQQLKPVKETINKMSFSGLPQQKKELDNVKNIISKLSKEIDTKQEELQDQQCDESMAKVMQPDVLMIDRYLSDIKELDKKIATQMSMISSQSRGFGNKSIQEVTNEKEEVQLQLNTSNQQLDHKRQKLCDYSEKVNRLHGQVNSLNSRKLQIETDLQQQVKLEEQKATLRSENIEHTTFVKESKEKQKPLEEKIEQLLDMKDCITADKEEIFDQMRTKANEVCTEGINKVNNYTTAIERYEKTGKVNILQEKKDMREELKTKLDSLEKEKKKLHINIDEIRKDLSMQQVREHELKINLQLRKKQKDVEQIEEKLLVAQEKLGEFDVQSLAKEERALSSKLDSLKRDKDTAVGRQAGFREQIKSIETYLKSDMYKDASVKHNQTMIKLRTTEMANLDLQKYYAALDKAIMKYHTMKMDEINKIIRDLWRNTYKGNDIETIEIRSDEDESALMKRRRSYNYRVVMIKGDAVLDMRGRCSAGQKVLASLIIRLALAETFCLNCGILSLDEPTTNLDRDNIESLANALVDIIKSRHEQYNFQLVVITHDEEFVELLGRSEYVEFYYQMKKNEYGCSRIHRANVQQLHS